jgi:hypothetical protein
VTEEFHNNALTFDSVGDKKAAAPCRRVIDLHVRLLGGSPVAAKAKRRRRGRAARSPASSGRSDLRLIERAEQFRPKEEVKALPRELRGIYVLYKHHPRSNKFDVLYVGMAAAGKRRGIKTHAKRRNCGRTFPHLRSGQTSATKRPPSSNGEGCSRRSNTRLSMCSRFRA